MIWVLSGQVVGAVGMLGVIWTMQLVHYPLMAMVPADAFVAYEQAHTRRISWVVGPLMAIEGGAALVVLARTPDGVPVLLPWLGGLAVAVALGTTAFVSARLHGRLSAALDVTLVGRLVRTNWIRTVAWTTHGIVAVVMLAVAT